MSEWDQCDWSHVVLETWVELLSHLLLLVYEIVAGHHHKVIPPSQTSGHRHVLLLRTDTNTEWHYSQNTTWEYSLKYRSWLYFDRVKISLRIACFALRHFSSVFGNNTEYKRKVSVGLRWTVSSHQMPSGDLTHNISQRLCFSSPPYSLTYLSDISKQLPFPCV